MAYEYSGIHQTVFMHNSTQPGNFLAMLLEEPSEAVPEHQVVPADQTEPTASSQLTGISYSSKPFLTVQQKTTVMEKKVTFSSEGSQINILGDGQSPLCRSQLTTLKESQAMTFSGDQTLFEDCPITSRGDQAYGGQVMTPSADQTYYEYQKMILNSYQNVNRSQVTIPNGKQTYCSQVTAANGHQTYYGQVTAPNGHQTYYGQVTAPNGHQTYCSQVTAANGHQTYYGQVTAPNGHQTYYGQVTAPNGHQTSYSQVTAPNGHQTCYGQVTAPNGHQTSYSQVTAPNGHQTCYGQVTAPNGHQTSYSQVTAPNGHQTCYGQVTAPNGHQTLYRSQMTRVSGDQTYDAWQMMPPVCTQMPYVDGFLYNSNSYWAQGQPPECFSSFPLDPGNLPDTKSNLKTEAHQLQESQKPYVCSQCSRSYAKSSHLRTHFRKHTGEKPYSCSWFQCNWKFSRSDELKRHMRKHTGERPYECKQCHKRFPRSDHLRQHEKLHGQFPPSTGAVSQ